MSSWVWLVAGLVLLVVEVLTPGTFFVVVFAVGAFIAGGVAALLDGESLWLQLLVFSVASLGSMALLRQRLVRWLSRGPEGRAIDSLVGEIAVLADDLAPGTIGKAELRGTAWAARNVDTRSLGKGERCRVERVDGLTLAVRAE
jgi:membrane protein implicated in regulation of membrane protease activity